MTDFVSKSYSRMRGPVRVCCCLLLLTVVASVRAGKLRSTDHGWQAEGRFTLQESLGNEKQGRKFRMQRDPVLSVLKQLPHGPKAGVGTELWLPMPDGALRCFLMMESSVMVPELAARFPQIKTYQGRAVGHPEEQVRVDVGPKGLHAQILSHNGNAYIDPINHEGTEYLAYFANDARRTDEEFDCLADTVSAPSASEPIAGGIASDGMVRTYRLAVAATGEYAQYHGGTVEAGLGAIVTAVNRLNGIYESELSIRFMLVAANDQIIYTNASTDPYSNNDGVTMLSQNQANLDAVIGPGNYDIGHVFSTGGGGIAQVGSVCVPGWKARGVTGRAVPLGDSFYVDYFAHEVGHQFGAHHTFNGVAGSCNSNNRSASTAYEPGSGSTIMSYSGICGTDNLQYSSDAYFHSASLVEIKNFMAGSCPTPASIGNNPPVVTAGSDYVIPAGTPFELVSVGSDPDGDLISFCWEQLDLGPAAALAGQDSGSGPLFRSFPPTSLNGRTFPQLENVLFNMADASEVLPTTSRTLHFRITARDQNSGGGSFAMDEMQVLVESNAGPFKVLSPNTSAELSGEQTVLWDVAQTDVTPVSTTMVNILLSTNGGYDFPIVLATNAPNDGSETVLLPDIYSSHARIKVQAVGNIFFDINDADFSIVPSAAAQLVVVTETNSFSNPTQVLIPASGTKGNASEYPLTIQVEGVQGALEGVTVQLHGLSHNFVDDLDILLVGPGGQNVLVLSDSGAGAIANNIELGFSDEGLSFPNNGSLSSGTYQPANIGSTGDSFPVSGPYGSSLSVFNDTNPNGSWSLYIVDDSIDDSGVMTGGWTLNLRTTRVVEQTNEPPVIVPPSVQFVHAGSNLVLTNQASDPDGSGDLTFALRPGAPSGVAVDESGVLTWSPGSAFVGTTNYCTLSVTDSGSPAMTSEADLELIVVGAPVMHPLQVTNGLVHVRWESIPGTRYQVESTDDLSSGQWANLGEGVLADGFTSEITVSKTEAGQRFFCVRVVP